MARRARKCSKRGGWSKGGQENLQNVKKSVAEYWNGEDRHAQEIVAQQECSWIGRQQLSMDLSCKN